MEKSAPNIWASIYTPPPPNAFVEENNSKLVEVQRALGITHWIILIWCWMVHLYITLFPFLQMPLILIIRNEHKMAFSPLKIIPLPAQNCLFTVQNWLTNFHVSQLKNWSPRLVQLEKCLMKDIIFWWAWYVCSWRPNVIYWRQKMYWNPFSISPFRPNYVILEMYLPLAHTKIFVELLKEMWFVILKNIQNWTFISLHWLLETLQSKLQLKSPENKIKWRSCVTTLVIC